MTNASATEKYVSARPRAIALQVLVLLQLALTACTALAWALETTGSESDLGQAIISLCAPAYRLDQLAWFAACIVFLTWVYRSTANLPALGSMRARFTPSDAVVAYFIPLVNLVRGYQVMATIWTESQPPLVDERGLFQRRKTTLVNWWWALYLGQMVAPLLALPMFYASARAGAVVGMALFHAVRLAVVIMFLVVITATQKRQDAMWDDLERQRRVPQPTAQYLR